METYEDGEYLYSVIFQKDLLDPRYYLLKISAFEPRIPLYHEVSDFLSFSNEKIGSTYRLLNDERLDLKNLIIEWIKSN